MIPLNSHRHTGMRSLIILMAFCVYGMGAVAQEDAEKLFKKGMERQQAGEFSDAIAAYDKALETDSTLVKAYLQRGFCKVANKDYQGGIDDYTKLISYDPSHTWAYISRGSARNRLNDFKNALADFDKALELDPKNQEAFNNRGFSKKGLGDFEGACNDWHQSRKMGNEEAGIIIKNNHCK
jgi:tetratricopeptide (TPR) repeat protein